MLCQELASKRDLRHAPQNLFVRWVGLQRNLLKYFESPGRGLAITVDYNCRMNILVDQFLRLFQKLARNDYRRGCAVSDLVILSLRDFDHHLRSRVLNFHLIQNGGSIVRDRYISKTID